MNITFLEHYISLHSWNSKSQMIVALKLCEAGFIMLGEDLDYASEFYSVIGHLDQPEPVTFGIGICAQRHGLEPHLFLEPENSTVIIGSGFKVWRVRIPNGEIIYEMNLDSIFHKFIQVSESNRVLIQHEIGVIALDPTGNELWNLSKDVITKSIVEKERLILEFMDTPPMSIRISDGDIIPF